MWGCWFGHLFLFLSCKSSLQLQKRMKQNKNKNKKIQRRMFSQEQQTDKSSYISSLLQRFMRASSSGG